MTDREEDGSEGGREATDADADDGAKCERRRRKTDGRTDADVALSCGLVRRRQRGEREAGEGEHARERASERPLAQSSSTAFCSGRTRTGTHGRTGEGRPLLRLSGIIRIT